MIGAIIQARTGSTRLPNKIFAEIAGAPLIHQVVSRLKKSKYIEKIVVATTNNTHDDKVIDRCTGNDVLFYRGEEENVLSRFYQAAKAHGISIIVRITCDDPLKDYTIIDEVIMLLKNNHLDFAYNNNPPSFPEGLDVEVFTYEALEIANQTSQDAFEQEHVTQYFYRNPLKFKQQNMPFSRDISSRRLTIDTELDLELIRKIYELRKPESDLLLGDVIDIIDNNPGILMLNQNVTRSHMYGNKNLSS